MKVSCWDKIKNSYNTSTVYAKRVCLLVLLLFFMILKTSRERGKLKSLIAKLTWKGTIYKSTYNCFPSHSHVQTNTGYWKMPNQHNGYLLTNHITLFAFIHPKCSKYLWKGMCYNCYSQNMSHKMLDEVYGMYNIMMMVFEWLNNKCFITCSHLIISYPLLKSWFYGETN